MDELRNFAKLLPLTGLFVVFGIVGTFWPDYWRSFVLKRSFKNRPPDDPLIEYLKSSSFLLESRLYGVIALVPQTFARECHA